MKIGFGLGISDYRLRGGLTFSPEALAWEADIIANGGTIDPLVLFTIDQNFIIPNVSGGNWSKFDRLHLWLTNSNSIAARTSMEGNNHFASFVNAVVFDDNGIKSDGISAYVDLNFNPNTQGVNYTLNSCSLGYVAENPTYTGTKRSIGCLNGAANQRSEVYESDGSNVRSFTNSVIGVVNTFKPTGNVIFYGKRDADPTNALTGVNTNEITGVDASSAIPNFNAFELTTNYANTPLGDYDTDYHHLSWHGAPDLDFALIHTTINNLEAALLELRMMGYDEDYKDILRHSLAQNFTLPSAAEQAIANQLMVDLKAASSTGLSGYGLIKIYATNINYGGSIPANLGYTGINWASVGNNQSTRTNTITQTVKEGYSSDGVSSYISENQNCNVYLQDDFFYAQYTKIITADLRSGATDTLSYYGQYHGFNGIDYALAINNIAAGVPALSVISGQSHFISGARTNSSNFDAWKDGSNITTVTAASFAPINVTDETLSSFFAGGGGGRFFSNSANVVGIKIKGKASEVNQLSLYTAINNYLTALSAL